MAEIMTGATQVYPGQINTGTAQVFGGPDPHQRMLQDAMLLKRKQDQVKNDRAKTQKAMDDNLKMTIKGWEDKDYDYITNKYDGFRAKYEGEYAKYGGYLPPDKQRQMQREKEQLQFDMEQSSKQRDTWWGFADKLKNDKDNAYDKEKSWANLIRISDEMTPEERANTNWGDVLVMNEPEYTPAPLRESVNKIKLNPKYYKQKVAQGDGTFKESWSETISRPVAKQALLDEYISSAEYKKDADIYFSQLSKEEQEKYGTAREWAAETFADELTKRRGGTADLGSPDTWGGGVDKDINIVYSKGGDKTVGVTKEGEEVDMSGWFPSVTYKTTTETYDATPIDNYTIRKSSGDEFKINVSPNEIRTSNDITYASPEDQDVEVTVNSVGRYVVPKRDDVYDGQEIKKGQPMPKGLATEEVVNANPDLFEYKWYVVGISNSKVKDGDDDYYLNNETVFIPYEDGNVKQAIKAGTGKKGGGFVVPGVNVSTTTKKVNKKANKYDDM